MATKELEKKVFTIEELNLEMVNSSTSNINKILFSNQLHKI